MSLPEWREEALTRAHDRKGFDCGQKELNDFLNKYARQAQDSGASRTWAAINTADGVGILGFYTLSPAQIEFSLAPEAARPAGGGRHAVGGFRLGRLAVSKDLQGRGMGGQLLICAARRCIRASAEVGGSMLLIDAKDERAAMWYRSYGALALPGSGLSLVLPYAVFIEAMKRAGSAIL